MVARGRVEDGTDVIRYSLKCAGGHAFDAWFGSSDAYEKLRVAGQVTCALCGSADIEKALMAPALGAGTRKAEARAAGAQPGAVNAAAEPGPLATPSSPLEAALAELRRRIERDSDYVGEDFAAEARRIHEGDSDRRAIWGEATVLDAKSLAEDGIPVLPVPWMTKRNG